MTVQHTKICRSELAASDILRRSQVLRSPTLPSPSRSYFTSLRRFHYEIHNGKVSCIVLYKETRGVDTADDEKAILVYSLNKTKKSIRNLKIRLRKSKLKNGDK
ncbi:hypothetical protein EVAR_23625_1 [Eumeta japonica]|uniref:Uncharacterized protein n=1 Tax=Eumeta variegata TaxID=151549 RepID=A0A4C1X1K3_EUMVA|nr:hypothetical protein EVAR_23625_1 [Eumeta japonica]